MRCAVAAACLVFCYVQVLYQLVTACDLGHIMLWKEAVTDMLCALYVLLLVLQLHHCEHEAKKLRSCASRQNADARHADLCAEQLRVLYVMHNSCGAIGTSSS